jgi:hypothetical protein
MWLSRHWPNIPGGRWGLRAPQLKNNLYITK